MNTFNGQASIITHWDGHPWFCFSIFTGKSGQRWLTGSFDDLMSMKRVLAPKTDETHSLPALNDDFWKKRISIWTFSVKINQLVHKSLLDFWDKNRTTIITICLYQSSATVTKQSEPCMAYKITKRDQQFTSRPVLANNKQSYQHVYHVTCSRVHFQLCVWHCMTLTVLKSHQTQPKSHQ